MWLTILSAALKLLGLADMATKFAQSAQDRHIGRELQHADDVVSEDKVLRAELDAATKPVSTQTTADALGKGAF